MKNSTLKSLDYWLKGKKSKDIQIFSQNWLVALLSWSVSVFHFFKSHKEIDQQIFHLRSRSYGFSLTFNPPNECGEMMCLLFIIFPRLAELSSKFKRCHSFKMTTRNLFATEDFK